MELFSKTKAVKLRCHNDKYLVADEDKESVRQSRNGSSRKAIWAVEAVDQKPGAVRLRSCHGRYLGASDQAFLIGMTGNKAVQVTPEKLADWMVQWEPVRDGFQVKLRSWCETYLRANGGTPPWRNSVTHGDPHTAATRKWILWDVEPVVDAEAGAEYGSVTSHLESLESFASVVSDEVLGSEPGTPMAVTPNSSTKQIHISSGKFRCSGMDFFRHAKVVRLRSHHDKYLFADDDEESVTQDRNGSSKNARWSVEFVSFSGSDSDTVIRLKSCYGKYLTASNHPFLLGMTGRKVLQTLPSRLDSSLEWEPVKEGSRARLKTRYGNFLRGNGGVPPWRNSVTHDVPHRTVTQDWILWDVDVIEIEVQSPVHKPLSRPDPDPESPLELNSNSTLSPVSSESSRPSIAESNDSAALNSPPKPEGRRIWYQVADDEGEDEASERLSLTFQGMGVEELTRKLEEETGIEGLVVCTRNPLNGKPYPIRLQLPPNNATLNVVLVLKSSKLGSEFEKQGLI